MTISRRQAKEFWVAWSAGKTKDPKSTPRSWMAPAASPPVIRTPAFMLGGRFAVIREPHFMLDARPGESTPSSRADKAKSARLSLVDPSDESGHGT